MSGVNKLRGKSKDKDKESDESQSDESDHEAEPEPEEPQPQPIDSSDPLKRSQSAPLPSVSSDSGTPPQSPRRHSDPPAPLESILTMGTCFFFFLFLLFFKFFLRSIPLELPSDFPPFSSVPGPRDPNRAKNNIKFNEIVTVRRTWAKKDYDRKGEVTWKLTPEKAIDIRNELNEFKKEMDIHEESKCNTHFY